MSKKRPRFIGTTEGAIAKAETELNFKFPPPFRVWLIQNNGLGFEGISIFPVLDERDLRMTWNSIVRNFNENWLTWLENFEDKEINFKHLLPFAEFGTGDYYCFDYSKIDSNKEISVIHWSHETGETKFRAANFIDFLEKIKRGDFDSD